jgi:hypothetical protein
VDLFDHARVDCAEVWVCILDAGLAKRTTAAEESHIPRAPGRQVRHSLGTVAFQNCGTLPHLLPLCAAQTSDPVRLYRASRPWRSAPWCRRLLPMWSRATRGRTPGFRQARQSKGWPMSKSIVVSR